MKKLLINKLSLTSVLFLISFSSIANVFEGLSEIPNIPAFLPTVDQVPATQPMPIDGTWMLPSIGKKIRIDSGRAYAVDGWLHLFVLDIQPGMVVWKSVSASGPGRYSGEDLPLMGRFTARAMADRSLSISVAGMFGPVNLKAIPIQLNNEGWYSQEMQAAGLGNQGFGGQSQNNYQMSPPPGSMGQQNGFQQQNGYQQQNQNQNQYNNNQQYPPQNNQYNNQQNYQQNNQQNGQFNYQSQNNRQQNNQQPYNQQQYRQPTNGGQQNYNNGNNNHQQNNGYNPQINQYPPQNNPNNGYQNQQQQSQGQSQQSNQNSRELECEETVYDPETDTVSCYTEGENE